MVAKGKARAEIEGAVVATLRRVGLLDKERLTWLVGAVQKRIEDMPPGERNDLRLALSVYAHLDPHPETAELVMKAWRAAKEEFWWAHQRGVTDEEARSTLADLEGILRAAARRETLTAPSRGRESESLSWSKDAGRYYFGEHFSKRTLQEAARVALWRQLVAHGHLLRECPAPARRGKNGESCGLLFVAKRPNQDYCSATCQGRAGTRAFRAGTPTAAAQRHEAEREG